MNDIPLIEKISALRKEAIVNGGGFARVPLSVLAEIGAALIGVEVDEEDTTEPAKLPEGPVFPEGFAPLGGVGNTGD